MPRKKNLLKQIKKYSKTKGFTLIELLAVVVILGLLVAIAYPAVNKYILETKDTTYTLHESDMKTAAKNMMSECIQNDTEDCVPESGESKTIYLSELIDTKYSNPIKDPDNKDGYCKNDKSYVIVTNTGDSTVKLDYQVCLTCDKYASGKCSELEPGGKCDSTTDTTPPTCGEVVGGSTLWTNKDRIISIKCNDVGCGCTKKSFYKTFKETSQKGSITITDKAGRSTSCEVNVYIDKVLPTCELEVIGNIGENEWYGNDAPIVRFKSKTDDLSGIATYGMGLSSKNLDFNKKDSYTAPTGISTIYGYVKDNAGNVGTCHVEVKYDPIPATLDKTDYGSIVYPKSDIASVDGNKRVITLDKTILDEYGDIYGLYFYQKSTSTGMTVTAKTVAATVKTVTLSSGVTKPIRILFDSAIRIGEYDLTIDLGANNNVDKISRIEVITRNDTVGYYTNQNVTLYINSHDSLSGKAYYTFDGNIFQEDPYYTFTKNTNAVGIGIKDHAGNITDITSLKITNIDKLKPSCSLKKSREKDGHGEDWYNKSVDILFASQSDAAATSAYAMSKVRDWSLNNTTGRGNPKSRNQSVATASTIDTGYVIDNAGNINTCSSTVKLDLTDPIAGTVTMTAGGSNISSGAEVNKDVTVTLANGSDTGSVQSGHYTTKFTVVRDGTTVSNSITGSKTYTAEGNYTVTVRTEDQSGRSSTRSYTFMIDKTAPNCGSVTNGSTTWTNTARTLSVGCADSSGVARSGCTQETYSTNYTTSTKTSTITIRDEAGNTKACPVNVYIDVDYPKCASDNGSTSWTAADRTITVNCSDTGGSNCTQASYSKSYTTSTKTSSIDIRDVAGNVTTCPINVYVDKTPPSCDSNNGSTTWTNADRTITVNCGDGHSGCVQAKYSKSYTTSTKTDTITIKDNVGHTTTCPINVYVDKGVPTCGSVSGSSTTWTNSNRTISVGCNDTGGSGCTSSSFSYTWSSSKQTSAITIKDAAGNTRSCGVNVYVDKDAPTCGTKTGTSTTWTSSSRTISVGCNDTGGSGCAATKYSQTYSTTTKTSSISIKDTAGNSTSCSVNVYVDKTPPTCTITKHTSTWQGTACGDEKCGVCGEIKCTDAHSGNETEGPHWFFCYKHSETWTKKDNAGNSTTVTLATPSTKTEWRSSYCSEFNWTTQTDSCTYGGVTVCGTKKCDGYTASQCSCTENVQYWSGSCSIKCTCSKQVKGSCKTWGSWSSWGASNYCNNTSLTICKEESRLRYY